MKEFNLSDLKVDGTPASAASIAAPGSSETVLMLPFEGSNNDTTTTDRSSTGHSITFNGGAKISTTQEKFGSSSLYLDGNGDYLSLAAHADFNFGTGDFTWECWVRFDSVTISGEYLFAAATGSSGFFIFRWDGGGGGSGNWSYGYSAGGNNWADTLSADTWYHLAVVRSSGDIKVYRDGVEKGSAWTHNVSLNPSSGMFIGKSHGTEYIAGYLDDFRMTKGVARYTSNFTPSTSSDYTAAVVGSSTKHIVVDSDGTGAEEGDLKENNNRIAKAWVNFNGTGTIAIRESYNVSSLTDNATGDYTVTFSTAMTDANYVMAGSALNSTYSHSGDDSHRLPMPQKDGYLASSIRVFTKYGHSTGEGQEDEDIVNVIIFGN